MGARNKAGDDSTHGSGRTALDLDFDGVGGGGGRLGAVGENFAALIYGEADNHKNNSHSMSHVGFVRTRADHGSAHTITAVGFFRRYPNLYPFLSGELRRAVQALKRGDVMTKIEVQEEEEEVDKKKKTTTTTTPTTTTTTRRRSDDVQVGKPHSS